MPETESLPEVDIFERRNRDNLSLLQPHQEHLFASDLIENRLPAEVSREQALQASSVFADDYALVGHAGEPLQDITELPRPHAEYSNSSLLATPEERIQALRGKKVAIGIFCMDKDGARFSSEAFTDQVKAEHGDDTQVIYLTLGGGIVNFDEAVIKTDARDIFGTPTQLGRASALHQILSYLTEEIEKTGSEGTQGQVMEIFATGHNCRCGACAFCNANKGLPEALGVEKGSPVENAIMARLIQLSAKNIVPDKYWDVTKLGLANFGLASSGENRQFKDFMAIEKVEEKVQ